MVHWYMLSPLTRITINVYLNQTASHRLNLGRRMRTPTYIYNIYLGLLALICWPANSTWVGFGLGRPSKNNGDW